MSYRPWSRKEMDMTELIFFFFLLTGYHWLLTLPSKADTFLRPISQRSKLRLRHGEAAVPNPLL